MAYRHYFCIDFDRDVNMSWLQTRDDFFGGCKFKFKSTRVGWCISRSCPQVHVEHVNEVEIKVNCILIYFGKNDKRGWGNA